MDAPSLLRIFSGAMEVFLALDTDRTTFVERYGDIF